MVELSFIDDIEGEKVFANLFEDGQGRIEIQRVLQKGLVWRGVVGDCIGKRKN